jgi:hypothetical protein
MNYVISDFKNLAGAWFNEFLPKVVGKKATFIEKAGIVYINNVNIESLRKRTMKFFQKSISNMVESTDAIHIFVQEPKPVNNVRIRPALKLVENCSLDSGNRDRILHLANRRYVFESESVYISQNKEMDEFLSTVFTELSGMSFIKSRFYPLQSLGMSDMISCAYEFFPKSALIIQGNYECNTIKVHSSNDVLGILSDKIMKGKPLDSETLDYISRCRKSLLGEIENLV